MLLNNISLLSSLQDEIIKLFVEVKTMIVSNIPPPPAKPPAEPVPEEPLPLPEAVKEVRGILMILLPLLGEVREGVGEFGDSQVKLSQS